MAISSPLLEASIDGARGVLLSISGGSDLGLFEINEAAAARPEAAHPDANIIFGAVIDDALGDEVRVTVIAAGFDGGSPPRQPFRGDEVRSPAATSTQTPVAVDDGARHGRGRPAAGHPDRGRREPTREPRTIVFDDAADDDDLDVPDFLK